MEGTDTRSAPRPPGLAASTLAEAFQLTAERYGDRTAIRTKEDAFSCTWGEYRERVERVARGLAKLGVSAGDTVGLMLTNRPEFHFVDTAALHLGATPFSAYNTSSPEQLEYLVRDAGNKVMITERALLDSVMAVRERVPELEHVVVVDGEGGTVTLAELEADGDSGFDYEAAWRSVQPQDVVTLIYTSGTTGPPKGVQITHANLIACVLAYDGVLHFPEGGAVVSYLPMAHVAERNVSQYLPMLCGTTVTCCPNPRDVVGYLPEVRPTWFFGVPRIWEKLKAGLEAMLEGLPDAEQKARLQGAVDIGLRRTRALQAGEQVPEELEQAWQEADREVLSNVRAMLGLDRIEACNVGAAPTPAEVIEFFHALGIPLAELWGMSETTAAGTCNPPGRIRIGTVGPPQPGIEIELADDGEILVRGPILMAGYRNQPEKTRETYTDDGWLKTGDIGEFDDAGYLKIVDRKKELIIGAGGKNMSPANIEARVKSSSLVIGQVIAIGDGRPYNVALITLDPDYLPIFAQANGLEGVAAEVLATEQAVLDEVGRGVELANTQLSRVEQIKRFEILPGDWAPGGDELTPTMKLKRRPIHDKYAALIDCLYAD